MTKDGLGADEKLSRDRRRFVQAGGLLAANFMLAACGGEDGLVADSAIGADAMGNQLLLQAVNVAGQSNLALLASAVMTGSAGNGRGSPRDIVFDPVASAYPAATDWNEYGVPFGHDLGLLTEANAFWWQVAWPEAKTINTISFGGAYSNQPQATTRWKIESLLGSTWTVIAQGAGGWIDGGIFGWGGPGQQPVSATAVRVKAWSDGVNALKSIHLRGRGGRSLQIDDRGQSGKATLIQYLAKLANNAPGQQNLALLSDATATGSASNGRGSPADILFDPATNAYRTQTGWNEYGVAFNQSLGLVNEANAFWWQVAWLAPKFLNSVSIGGAYPNQPQVSTRWRVEVRIDGAWSTLAEGLGGWIDDGFFAWGGGNQAAVSADALRVKAWSDGASPLVSMHLRGRGGQSANTDDRNQPQKAVLVQYLPRTAVANILLDTDIGPDCDDVGTVALMHALADLGEARILGVGVTVSNPWSAPTVDAINTWYRRPDLPIGTLKENNFLLDSPYTENVARNFPNDLQSGANAPDAVFAHRNILAAQPDGSVTLVAVGPLNNMRNLMRSTADANSSLGGRELIIAKVKILVVMGCAFPGGSEWNIEQDPAAAQSVVNEWPTDIVFSGAEVGGDVHTGHSLTARTPVGNPVRRAYEIHVGANQNRPSWDQTAMLFAVRGVAGGLFTLSAAGTVAIAGNGSNSFAASAAGRHRYMVKQKSNAEIAATIEALMIRAPG